VSMANVKIEAPAEAASESAAESLGWQLRAALPPLRLHSIAIFSPAGDVLWLSEGVLGPDEQGFAAEALSDLQARPAASHRDIDFLDGRGAVFLPIRSPQARLAGLVMILVDAKALTAGNLSTRIATSAVNDLLERLGRELPAPQQTESGSPRNTSDAPTGPPAQLDPVGEITVEILAPQDVDEILTFELPQIGLVAEQGAAVSADPSESVPAAMSAASPQPGGEFGLRVEELAKLRPAGRLRRFHIVWPDERTPAPLGDTMANSPAAESGPLENPPSARDAAERLVSQLAALLAWVDTHSRPQHTPCSFSLTVSAEALETQDLPERLLERLVPAGSHAAAIGFELDEALYARRRAEIDRLLRAVEPLGCFIVVDDFTFDPSALELLRSKRLILVKVHPQLVAAALRDRLAQARIVAISQAARVLGIHCVAKHVTGQAARRWLTAAGFDFALGPLFDAPRTLASLAAELASV
jgi:EAL domain-containing protein (putative c-di-GMP-specific phosphodiesterase class I)